MLPPASTRIQHDALYTEIAAAHRIAHDPWDRRCPQDRRSPPRMPPRIGPAPCTSWPLGIRPLSLTASPQRMTDAAYGFAATHGVAAGNPWERRHSWDPYIPWDRRRP